MPQVNAFNFQLNPQSLAQLGNVRPDYMPDVWQWQENAAKHDKIGLADLMRASQHEAAMDPGRLARQEADLQSVLLGNKGKELENEGRGYDNRSKKVKAELEEYTLPQAKITAWNDLLKKASDDEMGMAENEIYKLLRSSNLKEQAIGKQLEGGLKEAVKQRLQTQGQLQVQGSANAAAMARQKQQQEHALQLEGMRTARAVAVQGMRNQLAKEKQDAGINPKKWQELAVSLAIRLQRETDEEVKAQLNAELQFAQQMAERLAPAVPPQVDPSKVGDGKLRPGRDPMPSAPGVNSAKPDPLGIR